MVNDDQLREVPFSSETIYDGKVVHLERWQVSLPNGNTAVREVIKHIGAAAVVPLDTIRKCLLRIRRIRKESRQTERPD